jgi:hypothetical protein
MGAAMDVPEEIQKPSWAAIYLRCYRGSDEGHQATGFTVRHEDRIYLITNWHVVTGRNPRDGTPESVTPDPQTLHAWHHDPSNLGKNWIEVRYEIRDAKNGNPRWLEHPRGRMVDVVAIPLTPPEEVATSYFDYAKLAAVDMIVLPSEPVSIIGFPYGQPSVGRLPVWKTGHVASEMTPDCEGKPVFYIDATTKPGMSGAPVIARRVGGFHCSKGWCLGVAADRFLGVYSGQYADAGIGVVWKPSVIDEILANGPADECAGVPVA